MSDQANEAVSRELREKAIPLLEEYRAKLAAIADQARESGRKLKPLTEREQNSITTQEMNKLRREITSQKFELMNLREAFVRLQVPASQLAQYISQRITHAAVEELLRIELRLRLAEFEAAIARAQQNISSAVQ